MAATTASNGVTRQALPAIDVDTCCLGGYGKVVEALREELGKIRASSRQLAEDQALEIVVLGHGGRDTWGWLGVIEAVCRDDVLRRAARVSVLTCSWADDTWEATMKEFVAELKEKYGVPASALQFNCLKFHEKHDALVARIRRHLEGKHVIVQCEQGVDFFVEPLTSEYLQDNYEDHFVHELCMSFAEARRLPVYLLQTNTDLDVSRGIDETDINKSIFCGNMQQDTFARAIAFESEALPQDETPPAKMIDLAVKIGGAKDKRQAFKQYLNIDLNDDVSTSSFYATYVLFAASRSNAVLPVAGILDLMSALMGLEPSLGVPSAAHVERSVSNKSSLSESDSTRSSDEGLERPRRLLRAGDHKLPWTLKWTVPPAPPQWLLARLLQPREVRGGSVRVLSQFRTADMQSALSIREYLCKWMQGRTNRRVCGNVKIGPRFAQGFWNQLTLAKRVAAEVMEQCPDFRLWSKDGAVVLQALKFVEGDVVSRSEALKAEYQKYERVAVSFQGDFALCPSWLWCRASFIMILDFTCRLLESKKGVEAELLRIQNGLPDISGKPPQANGALAEELATALSAGLVRAWKTLS